MAVEWGEPSKALALEGQWWRWCYPQGGLSGGLRLGVDRTWLGVGGLSEPSQRNKILPGNV